MKGTVDEGVEDTRSSKQWAKTPPPKGFIHLSIAPPAGEQMNNTGTLGIQFKSDCIAREKSVREAGLRGMQLHQVKVIGLSLPSPVMRGAHHHAAFMGY